MKRGKLQIGALWFKVKLLGMFSKVCRIFKKTIVYQSKMGYKELNPVYLQQTAEDCKEINLCAQELYLGIDFLKDTYSLIDVPLRNSPHYHLMESLQDDGEWESTEYVSRMLTGALDERYEILAFYRNKSYFHNCYQKRKAEIGQNQKKLVSVYQLNGRYYLHDGKHRAALCALMGIDVPCKVLSHETVLRDFNTKKIQKVMKSRGYTKHRSLFSAMMDKG